MPMRIHSLEHAAGEGAAKIATWARLRGHALSATQSYLGEPLPEPDQFDLLVVMGGGMNVYQYRQYPWLRAERELVERTIEAGQAVLGVCLGAQMIADALGARVYQNAEKEIGWLPVRFIDREPPFDGFPPECTVFQWHGDTFDLPPNARRIAQSEGCANQAFIHSEKVIGLQFHIEVDGPAVASFVHGCDHELIPARYVQSADTIRAATPDLSEVDRGLHTLLDHLAEHSRPDIRA